MGKVSINDKDHKETGYRIFWMPTTFFDNYFCSILCTSFGADSLSLSLAIYGYIVYSRYVYMSVYICDLYRKKFAKLGGDPLHVCVCVRATAPPSACVCVCVRNAAFLK